MRERFLTATTNIFDFDNGIVNCNFLRAGRTQISFEAWSSSQVSMAMRDVICSDGGFVLSANGGKNALYLQGNQINIVSLQSSSGSDSWKPLIYNTETGEMRYKV